MLIVVEGLRSKYSAYSATQPPRYTISGMPTAESRRPPFGHLWSFGSARPSVREGIRAGCRLGRACLSRAVDRPAGQRDERNKECGHCRGQQLQVEGHCGEERLDPHFLQPAPDRQPIEARCLRHPRWEVGAGVLVRAYLTQSTLHDHIACESGDPRDYYLDRGC